MMHMQGKRESDQPVLSIVLRPLFLTKVVSYEKHMKFAFTFTIIIPRCCKVRFKVAYEKYVDTLIMIPLSKFLMKNTLIH